MPNINLANAKRSKNDEFYTQYNDIQKEIEAYLEFNKNVFRKKVVYANCDDPFESNFFRYFALNFNKLGLKQLITSSFKPSPIANTQLTLFGDDKTLPKAKRRSKINANKFIINEAFNKSGNEINLKNVARKLKENKRNEWTPLGESGDFRSEESVNLLKQSDIVVTNPPFSLFSEFVRQLFDFKKKFIIIGNLNAITYKDIFPLIMSDRLWLGNGFQSGNAYFYTPNTREFASGVYDEATGLVKFRNVCWFTNLDHGRRHQPISLMSMEDNLKFSKHKEIRGKTSYEKYDNYRAIEVPYTDAIPSDYPGVMGVPISFLNRYSPDQFEIVGATESEGRGFSNGLWNAESKVSQPLVAGLRLYKRVFIRHRKGQR
jgi:hypothetical protein